MMSGKRDSNSRPQPWQGCALPTELFPHNVIPIFPNRNHKNPFIYYEPLFRAENETRTRDPNLGKVVLYQLSYFRMMSFVKGPHLNLSGVCLSEEDETRTHTG